jgi:hypothetical protein
MQRAGRDARPWSVVETRIGEAIGFAHTLTCFPRAWSEAPPGWSLAEELEPVRLESTAFERRYEVRAGSHQDRNWLRQLLSPAFMDWLESRPSEDFGFELHEGYLRCFVPGAAEGERAERLQREADEVAERIRTEALEAEGIGQRDLGTGIPERIERAVAKVSFDRPPPDVAIASQPFRRYAKRDPSVYVAALGGVLGAYSAVIALLFEIGADVVDLIEFIVFFLPPSAAGVGFVLIGVVGYALALPEAIKLGSHRYGRVAFAREYARARGLRLESPQTFHRELMRVDLPAPAHFVMRGAVAGRRDGWLALCRSRRGPLASHYDVVILPTQLQAGGGAPVPGAASLSWKVDAGHLVIQQDAGIDREAPSLDAFCEAAAELAAKAEDRA